MNKQTFYKISSFSLGIFSIILLFLIIAPFAKSFSANEKNMTFSDELRIHRSHFLQIAESRNPLISQNLKELCRQEIAEIDLYIYQNKTFSKKEELQIREKIRAVNLYIKTDPYFSNDFFHEKDMSFRI